MCGCIEISLRSVAALLLLLRAMPYFQPYRPMFGGGGVLALLTAAFPRTGNPVEEFLFGTTGGGPRLPLELFGIAWWVLRAWLFKSLLQLALRRAFFPDNDEPQARRLFADMASDLIYVLAFVGIVGTVFKEPVSTSFATFPDVSRGTVPLAYACMFSDSLMEYELAFAVDNIAMPPGVESKMIGRIADRFRDLSIPIGGLATDTRIIQRDPDRRCADRSSSGRGDQP
jgi:hypothetical protein